ncbi:MAG: hypothetical protein RSB77_02440 [Bacilli bacterium]
MKKILKNNLLYFIITAIFIFIFLFQVFDIKHEVIKNNYIKENANRICQAVDKNHELCKAINKEYKNKNAVYAGSTTVIFLKTMLFGNISIENIFPIIIVVFSSIVLHGTIKNNISLFLLVRQSYKDFLFKSFKKIYKIVYCIPLALVFLAIVCFMTKDVSIAEQIELDVIGNVQHIKMGIVFCLIYAFNIFLLGIFIVNIVLIVGKSSLNLVITTIGSYLTFFILKIVIAQILPYFFFIFNRETTASNFLEINNFFGYDFGCEWWKMLGFALTLVISSSLIVFKLYKSKEELVISNA